MLLTNLSSNYVIYQLIINSYVSLPDGIYQLINIHRMIYILTCGFSTSQTALENFRLNPP